MPYITSVERIGIEKGHQQGKLEGKVEGRLEGKLEGETSLLERLLTRRFGPLNAETLGRLDSGTLEQLEQWADNLFDAVTLEDIFKNH